MIHGLDTESELCEFYGIIETLRPGRMSEPFDLEAYCKKTGRDYVTLACRAAMIEYGDRRPRWMAEAMAVLG
jgi:hypothetical protein